MSALTRPQATFSVPAGRTATRPPERRGTPRDRVPLLVARPGRSEHVRFTDLVDVLVAGDVLVVNTSATRPAAIDGIGPDGPVVVHLATDLGGGRWTIELRRRDGHGPVLHAAPGDLIALDGGGHLQLREAAAPGPAEPGRATSAGAGPDAVGPAAAGTAAAGQTGPGSRAGGRGVRLWRATVRVPGGGVEAHMARHGRPITYGAPAERFTLESYQTVFARQPGSAEMASAGRPFSHRLVTDLVSRGVLVLPLTLHAGVSSQEAGEPPQAEWFDVPAATAALTTHARRAGGRVVAVGTTATRALESAWDGDRLRPARGWTDLVITPERGTAVVDGLITGWHEPEASHLLLLEAVAGRDLVQHAYAEAVAGPYLWHEFGDSCLLLP